MVLWRISNYADLRGLGGLRAPGRWHLAGGPFVYLAEHPAAALLEILVHAEVSPRASIAEIGKDALPADWRDDLAWSRDAGSEWLAGGSSVLLRVPSAVTPYTNNYLMNPQHVHADELSITQVSVVSMTRAP